MNKYLTLLVFVGLMISCQAEPAVIQYEPIEVSKLDHSFPTITLPETDDKVIGTYPVEELLNGVKVTTMYDVYEGSRGGWYIKRISGKTGLEYKQYLSKPEQKAKVIKT